MLNHIKHFEDSMLVFIFCLVSMTQNNFFLPRPGLGRHDKLNLSDSAIMWEESDNSSCVINTDYKILWVVNSENYIYKRNALNRAKEVSI